MNIPFFQYGDYAEAYLRFQNGGAETYRDQRASVDFVAGLAAEHSVTTVAICDQAYDTVLGPGLRAIGLRYDDLTDDRLAALFDDLAPDNLVCRTPDWRVLREAKRRSIRTLPHFADMFANDGLRNLYRNLRLRRFLTGSNTPCVSNHSKNASLALHKALFLPRDRIVPWDRRVIETGLAPKQAIASTGALTVLYAGLLWESKGVDDALLAVKALSERAIRVDLTLASRDDPEPWRQRASALGIEDAVHFAGSLANEEVLTQMRAHDVVIVPTRHDYPEVLPNTLREALAVRTPVVISDHPAFAGRLRTDVDCLVFKAADPDDLADTLARVATSPDLYARLSENAAAALEKLPFGLYWDVLWDIFLRTDRDDTAWVRENSLEALGG